MPISQMFRVFKARRWLMLLVFTLFAALGTGVTLWLPKQYTADTALVLDVKVDPIIGALAPNMASPAYMATQIEILKSDPVAARVVKSLGLERSAKASAQWREATDGKIPLERYFGALLQKGLAAEALRGSNIINITFTAQDPVFAAAAANAFAQAYLDLSIEMRVEPAKQYAAWFDEQSKGLRSNLEQAQAKLSKFQREKGIVVSDERLDQENGRLNALSTQLAMAQLERVDATGRQRNSGSEMSPDVQQSPAVQGLKSELAKAETKLSEISSVVGINHPQRQSLASQVAELKQQLANEVRRVSGGSAVIGRNSAQKVAELQSMYDAQKKQLLSLRGEKDQIAVLARDVETAQRAYESASQRVSQLNLEGQTNQANVRVLSRAVEPLEPAITKQIVRIVGALLGAFILAAALALGLEMLDQRVRSPEDMLATEGVPVLGVLRPSGSKLPVYRRLSLPRPVSQPALPAIGVR